MNNPPRYYRGWSEQYDKWVYGYLVDETIYSPVNSIFNQSGYNAYSVTPESVGQWTGMLDNSKPEKEIFQGDILRNESGRLMQVIWFQSKSFIGWDLMAINSKGYPPNKNTIWEALEIVGSIFENPELLADQA